MLLEVKELRKDNQILLLILVLFSTFLIVKLFLGSNGMWLDPSSKTSRLISKRSMFGEECYPLTWQPYDRELLWIDKHRSRSCLNQTEHIFIGLSRERTYFLILLIFNDLKIEYHQLMKSASLGPGSNLH